MGRGTRTIEQQLRYARCSNTKIGTSRHAARTSGAHEKGDIYSCGRARQLDETASSFAKFMKSEHPEIKMVRDINKSHLQEWYNSRERNWSSATCREKISCMEIIKTQVERTYHCRLDWTIEHRERERPEHVRDKAMSRDDYERLRECLSERRGEAIRAVEITGRTGLRVREVACLRTERINTDKWCLEVREGAKNGRYRDVPIRSEDRDYFRALKGECERLGRDYVTNGVQPDSLNRGIRRAMKDLNIADKYPLTTDHAIRKMYAQERVQEEMRTGCDQRTAWNRVIGELGHGEDRTELMKTYAGAQVP